MARLGVLGGVLAAVLVVIGLAVGRTAAATKSVQALSSLMFSPASVNVAVGDTVSWSGLSYPHTVTWEDGSLGSSGGDTYSRTFDTAGTFKYYCSIHGGPNGVGMAGVVVVGDPATATSTATVTSTPVATATLVPQSGALSAALFGSNQVPAVTTSGYGGVRLTLDAASGTITGQYAFNSLTSSITNAHIHSGAAGTNGPVLIDFTSLVTATSGTFTKTGIAATDINAILANPGGYYFNVHTTNNPGGEVRGQLGAAPRVVATSLGASLLGANQVPPVSSGGSGTVVLTLDPTAGTINGTWNVSGVTSSITNGHIHAGPAGTNGPVIVDFSSQIPAAGGQFTTTKSGVAADVVNAILYAPAGFYVNLHTTANTSGEVRGQLGPQRVLLPAEVRAARID